MIVTLLTVKSVSSLALPKKVRGIFYLISDDDNVSYRFSIEAVEEKWILKANQDTLLYGMDGKEQEEVVLLPMQIYAVGNGGVVLYVEADTADRKRYRKIRLYANEEVSIGRSEQNMIVYKNDFVSNLHTRIFQENGEWIVKNNNSTNGTFLNGKAIEKEILVYGDVIYVMGLKIIFGKEFLALNNPDGKIDIRNFEQRMLQADAIEGQESVIHKTCPEKEPFFQSPRFKRDIEKEKIRIDMPPADDTQNNTPMALVIGPSVTMGLASMTSGVFTIHNALNQGQTTSAISSGVMCGSMLLGCVLWPVLNKFFEDRKKKKRETLRQRKYTDYLQKKEEEIRELCRKEEEILHENFRETEVYVERIRGRKRKLWERSPSHNDFLQFRIGKGDLPFAGEISHQEKVFSLEDDNLREAMYRVCETPHKLKEVPVTVSFEQEYCMGIVGGKQEIRELAVQLIIQLVASYSYKDVKLIFLLEKEDKGLCDFVKWLPHIWTDDKELRMTAFDMNDLKHITSVLGKEMEKRSQLSQEELKGRSPYYVLFAFNRNLEIRFELLEKIRAHKKNLNFSTISVCEKIRDLPKECTVIAELSDGGGKLYSQKDISGKQIAFTMDKKSGYPLRELGVKLANISLADKEERYQLPTVMTFLQMFGVGKIEHLNPLIRWKENDPVKSLETPIGVDTFGELFKLDLHQNAHGPHGLIAGMTGSGKSEFVMTYILSLAVNFHPDEVAFILIDYKGGGMAKSFADLPHTAGIITNLDGAAIKRSLVSIESELKYREEIFAEIGLRERVSNLDIYKYQKLYRENVVNTPLPHLFIISDEFAELKTQQPEFMSQLISAARIGRSLGVHLILATQKPSGVVDDQIWSNSRFRVCLKVQEKTDSMEMLKRPEAAELKDTGRFYLQVGYNELFRLGQSAWAGSLYVPQDKVEEQKDDGIRIIDNTGNTAKEVIPDKKKTCVAKPVKQLDAVVLYLKKIVEEECIRVKPLWLAPMPERILLEELKEKYASDRVNEYMLAPVVGEYDKPASQREKRGLVRLPLTEKGNALILGAAGSGKEQFLSVMMYSLLTEHTAEQLHTYVLDFGAETLQAFSDAPHVGDVLFAPDREKIGNLFKLLQGMVNERKKTLLAYGGNYLEYEKNAESPFASVVVVINNYAVFSEMYEELEETVGYFFREGVKYGIYFVVTAVALNDLRIRLRSSFSQTIMLNMNDETDYAAVFGNLGGLCPARCPGRGLVNIDQVYEFQTASVTDGHAPAAYIRSVCKKMAAQWNGRGAERIPILPDRVDADYMGQYFSKKYKTDIPVGIAIHGLGVQEYPLSASYISLVMGNGDNYINFVGNLIQLLETTKWQLSILDVEGKVKPWISREDSYFVGSADCEKEIQRVFALVRDRNNDYKTALEEHRPPETYAIQIVVIPALHALREAVGNVPQEMLDLILLKGAVAYNVFVIAAESASHISGFAYSGWYKANVKNDFGIWVGNGFREQYQLKASKVIGAPKNEEDGDVFGYVVKKGRAYWTKLMYAEEEEDAEGIG